MAAAPKRRVRRKRTAARSTKGSSMSADTKEVPDEETHQEDRSQKGQTDAGSEATSPQETDDRPDQNDVTEQAQEKTEEDEEVPIIAETAEAKPATRTVYFTNANSWSASVTVVTSLRDGQPVERTYQIPPKSMTSQVRILTGYKVDLPPRVKMMDA